MKALPVLQPLCCVSDADPLSRDEAAALAAYFKALADPTRVAIVNRLTGAAEVCVCDLTAAFDLSQPTVSHHLKILRDAGLVECVPPRDVGVLPPRAGGSGRRARRIGRLRRVLSTRIAAL